MEIGFTLQFLECRLCFSSFHVHENTVESCKTQAAQPQSRDSDSVALGGPENLHFYQAAS